MPTRESLAGVSDTLRCVHTSVLGVIPVSDLRPNFRMRLLARTLRGLREQCGLSQQEAGAKLRFSDKKMSRIEQGQVPGYHELLAMLDLYGVIVSDYCDYIRMFDRAGERGWWHAYGLDDRGFVSIEAEASGVREYEIGHVPGLLQTEAYMREAFVSAREPLEGEHLENQVAVRLRRQRRLTEEPLLHLHAVIDESALRTPACDRGQLDSIIQRAALPNVTVQVIPNDAGIHSGLYSNFFVLSFPHAAEPDLAYVEYGFGSLQIEQKPEVQAATMMFEHLADLALDEPDSLALLRRVSDEAEAREASFDARAARDRHRLA